MFLPRTSYHFNMDISGKVLYIKFDTCPPLYRYLGVYRRLRLACPPHASEAAVSCPDPHPTLPQIQKSEFGGGRLIMNIINL